MLIVSMPKLVSGMSNDDCMFVMVQPGDVFWCTADCGWVTGHTYLAYGPLLVGATQASHTHLHTAVLASELREAAYQVMTCPHSITLQVLFGSTPTFPTVDRVWEVIERYRVRSTLSHMTRDDQQACVCSCTHCACARTVQ
jgi:acyl-coenzyme A synthetase/AMP-(fatty) acid ligase